MKTVAIKV